MNGYHGLFIHLSINIDKSDYISDCKVLSVPEQLKVQT